MEIVKPTGDSTIKVVPRQELQYIVVIYRNISTDTYIVTSNFEGTYDDNKLEFDFTNDQKEKLKVQEGQFASFEVMGSATEEDPNAALLYRGRLFFTDQDIVQQTDDPYDINKDVYKEHKSDNEFIIY